MKDNLLEILDRQRDEIKQRTLKEISRLEDNEDRSIYEDWKALKAFIEKL